MLKVIAIAASFVLATVSQAAISSENSTYSVRPMSGVQFMPTKVWTDGEYTYVDIPEDHKGALPWIFRVDDERAQVVNYVLVQDGTQRMLKVPGVLKHGMIRLGDQLILIDQDSAER